MMMMMMMMTTTTIIINKLKAAILEDQEWKHQEYWTTVYS